MKSVIGQSNQQRTAARTAGISLIVMALAAFFSFGYAHETLVNLEDADATVKRLLSSPIGDSPAASANHLIPSRL